MAGPRQGRRTFDDAARRRAFWVAAPVVAAAIVGLSLLPATEHAPLSGGGTATQRDPAPQRRIVSPAPEPSSAAPSSTAPAPAVDSRPTATTPAAPALDAAARAQVLTQARRFLQALLRYEARGDTPATWRTLRRTATPELVEGLRAHPPRVPAGERPVVGRIAELTVADEHDAGAVTVAATIARGARTGPLGALFQRHQGTWRAVRVL